MVEYSETIPLHADLPQHGRGRADEVVNRTNPKTDAGFATEREVLLLSSRRQLSLEDLDRLKSLSSNVCDWDYLVNVASRNAVLPVVSKNLLNCSNDICPPDLRKELATYLLNHTRRNLFLTGKLVEVIKLFRSSGISCLPFKGPTLAVRAYRSVALRQFVDLDILVQPKDFRKASRILSSNGFRAINAARGLGRFLPLANQRKDIGFVGENDHNVRIELHWKLSDRYFAMPLDLEKLWARLQPLHIGGIEVQTLSFVDLLVYLCLHGARHGFERLGWICDIRELIDAEKNVDWKAVKKHAKDHGCERAVEFALHLTDELFGKNSVSAYFAESQLNDEHRSAIEAISNKIFSPQNVQMSIGDRYVYHLLLKEKTLDRVNLHLHYIFWYLKLALKPNAMDKALFDLPSPLYPLYYLLRPVRLVLRHFSTPSNP